MKERTFLLLCILALILLCILPFTCSKAEINNTLAYSISNTSSVTDNSFGRPTDTTTCQTVKATATETWDGVVIYLDRIGLSSSTDSVKVRFRKNNGCGSPNPATGSLDRDVYVKVSDIPDGDATRNTLPPDSIARGYAIWFIFSSPVNVTQDSCYCILFNKPHTDASNTINWFSGTNGYVNGSNYYTYNEVSWTDYTSDRDFRVIKDKYALVQVRRLPFNTRGVLTINSDIDNASVDYLDSLHRWLNTSQNVGGSWGQGLNGQIAGNEVWFGRDPVADSLGVYSKDVPFYFHGLDTTSNFYKDTIDNYISRRWADGNHSYGDCGWDGVNTACMDSTHVKKFLNYMLNRPSTFGKLYKAGLFVNHSSQLINFGSAGSTTALGDSAGTVYYHANKTCASGRFKFVWNSGLQDPGTSLYSRLTYDYWQGQLDSLNITAIPLHDRTFRDGTKYYEYYRVGRWASGVPDSLYKFFNQVTAKGCSDSTWISVVCTHLGKDGLDQDDRDSIKAVYDSASAWKLWIPSTKALFNQQAASAFAQITVDRPSGSKRRINIRSLYDWNWGSHVPDREEVYYLTFIAYAPESLIVTINASDTLPDSNMVSQQDVTTGYSPDTDRNKAMSWVGMYNRTAGRKTVIYTPPSAPPTGELILKPTAAGAGSGWTQFPATGSPFDKVDDPCGYHDSDTTYIYKPLGLPEATHSFNIGDCSTAVYDPIGSNTIDSVVMHVIGRIYQTAGEYVEQITGQWNNGVVDWLMNLIPTYPGQLPTSPFRNMRTLAPDGLAWTKAKINALQIGVLEDFEGAFVPRITALHIHVYHSAPPSGKRNRTAVIEQLLSMEKKK